MTNKEGIQKLAESIDNIRLAKECISQNRGYKREQAKEAHVAAADELCDAIVEVIEEGDFDTLPPSSIVAIATVILRELHKRGP